MNLATSIVIWITYFIGLYFSVFWFLTFIERGISRDAKKRLKKFPYVTIAIPCWNRQDTVSDTIKSALELNYPKDKKEIIVVNHGSSDNSAREIEKFKGMVRILNIARSPGERKGKPMNVALKHAKGEFFVCLDADSIATKNSLIEILPHFEDQSVGCILPSMKVYKPKNFWHKIQNSKH